LAVYLSNVVTANYYTTAFHTFRGSPPTLTNGNIADIWQQQSQLFVVPRGVSVFGSVRTNVPRESVQAKAEV